MSIFDREYSKEYTEVYTIRYNNRVIDYSLFDEEFLTLLIYYNIDIDCTRDDMIAKRYMKNIKRNIGGLDSMISYQIVRTSISI